MNCVLCRSANQETPHRSVADTEYGTYHPVDYARCGDCGLLYQNPLPEAATLRGFYPEDYRNYLLPQADIFSGLKKLQARFLARRLARHFHPEEKILEIGCGAGLLLLALKKRGYQNLHGSDFIDKSFRYLIDAGIEVRQGDVEQTFPFEETFDAIVMNNVIEHFADPIKVLKNARDHLSSNGKILLITPNGNASDLALFGSFWAGFHAPRHTMIFNDQNIRRLAQALGFGLVQVEPLADPGQWAISVQNFLQSHALTRVKLKNGMAWHTSVLSLISAPIAALQCILGRSSSMLCILERTSSALSD